MGNSWKKRIITAEHIAARGGEGLACCGPNHCPELRSSNFTEDWVGHGKGRELTESLGVALDNRKGTVKPPRWRDRGYIGKVGKIHPRAMKRLGRQGAQDARQWG